MNIKSDNQTLTYLLNYLTAEQWADALQPEMRLDKKFINRLLKRQEGIYHNTLRIQIDKILVVGRLEK